jgi:hypothetical protein
MYPRIGVDKDWKDNFGVLENFASAADDQRAT